MTSLPKVAPSSDALPSPAPRHVAIIMDGNGRWATSRHLPRTAGHKKGASALKEILNGCRALGIECLTLYAFSAENWKRPLLEITDLMELLRYYLAHEIKSLHQNGVRLRVIGDRAMLEEDIRRQIHEAEALTAGNTGLHLTVALSYGARQEIMRAVQQALAAAKDGRLDNQSLTEAYFESLLDTSGLPDPDLLIRTGGEQRLSNFLLWQSAYTELYFTPVLWPDFTLDHLREAMHEFARRERRYGSAGNHA